MVLVILFGIVLLAPIWQPALAMIDGSPILPELGKGLLSFCFGLLMILYLYAGGSK